MKIKKYLFNQLLRKYNKCKRRLSNLQAYNRNLHRQTVLEKHIVRLYEKLITLQVSIKRGTVLASLAAASFAFQSNHAQAQTAITFSTQVNPFGLSNNNDGYTSPAFADLDSDGDLDMLSGQYYGDFMYYKNTGTNTNPSFAAGTKNPFGLLATNNNYNQPAFADLDNDGDFDVVAGDGSGNFYYYENIGTASAPTFTNSVVNPFNLTQLGSGYSHLSFADLDNDGDLDLMAGSGSWSDNNFYYFENTGTNTNPSFAAVQTNPFGLAQQTSHWLGGSFGDIDKDGDFDIISQSGNSDFYFYKNSGTNTTPSFDAAVINPFALSNLYAVDHSNTYLSAFVDLNNDGKLDIMTGDMNGNFIFNKNTVIPGATLNFDGVDDYVSIPQSVSSDFTIEYWVRTTQTAGTGAWYNGIGLVDAEVPGVTNDFGTALVGSKFAFGVGNPDVTITSSSNINDGNWHHVAATREISTGAMKIYVDGSLETTGSGSTNVLNAPPQITIGSMQTFVSYFNGDIDEVRIWNRALCQGEIQNNMNAEVSLPQNGLLAYYKFNQGFAFQNNSTVLTLTDSSGNNKNGTLNNLALNGNTSNWIAPGAIMSGSYSSVFSLPVITVSGGNTIPVGQTTTLTATGASNYTWDANTGNATTASVVLSPTVTTIYSVQGETNGCLSNIVYDTVKVGNFMAYALNFDGNNDKVVIGNSVNNTLAANNKITVEAWVKPDNTNYLGCIVGNYQTSGSGMQFLLRRDGNNYVFWVDNGSGFNAVNSSTSVVVGAWTHLAGTWDGSVMSIYVNGVLSGTVAVSGSNLNSSTNEIWFGGNTAGTPEMFGGSIDEARIWNRALCQGEILNNMHGELHMPQTGLLAYYKFNEGLIGGDNSAITTLIDSSGNAIDGTLYNFALNGNVSNWVAPGAIDSGAYAPVFIIPTLTVSSNTVICAGVTTTLTASGVNSYTWSTGSTSDTTIVSPSTDATYTVTGDYYGCGSPQTAVTTVSVNPSPVINTSSGNSHTCEGATAIYTIASDNPNTDTYQWNWVDVTSPGVDSLVLGLYNETGYTTNSMTISPIHSNVWGPSATWGVHCAVTNTLGCTTKSAVDTIFIYSLPSVMVTANTQSFCIGSIDTLKATGATTYTWSANAGSVSASSVTVNPTGNSTYTVTGTDANGCVNTNTVAVTVNSLPNVLAGITSPTLCLGHIDTLVATGATTYTWSANAGGLTVGSVTVSPSTNDTYTVTGVDVNGCLNTSTVSVTVSNCGVGVKQYSNHTVNIYPNPSNGNFTIESDTELGKIFIHDMLNREVYSAKINQTNTTINIESLVSGIYYVTISGNTIKIVKQ